MLFYSDKARFYIPFWWKELYRISTFKNSASNCNIFCSGKLYCCFNTDYIQSYHITSLQTYESQLASPFNWSRWGLWYNLSEVWAHDFVNGNAWVFDRRINIPTLLFYPFSTLNWTYNHRYSNYFVFIFIWNIVVLKRFVNLPVTWVVKNIRMP